MHISVHIGKKPTTVCVNGQPIAEVNTPENAKFLVHAARSHFDFVDVSEDIIDSLSKWIVLFKEREYEEGAVHLTEDECADLFERLDNVVYNLERLVTKDREQRLARAMEIEVEPK